MKYIYFLCNVVCMADKSEFTKNIETRYKNSTMSIVIHVNCDLIPVCFFLLNWGNISLTFS